MHSLMLPTVFLLCFYLKSSEDKWALSLSFSPPYKMKSTATHTPLLNIASILTIKKSMIDKTWREKSEKNEASHES